VLFCVQVDIIEDEYSRPGFMIGGMTHIHPFPLNPFDMKGFLRDQICILMGGMAGERVSGVGRGRLECT
jgi:hypothetical protein